MDIEESESRGEIEEEFNFEPLSQRNDKKLVLSNQADMEAFAIFNRTTRVPELNRTLDPNARAQPCPLALKTEEWAEEFHHFMTKNKFRDERAEVLEVLRGLAKERGHETTGQVRDKMERSVMVVRVVRKEDTGGVVVIEDQTGKEKMLVKRGVVWVGMTACIEARWEDNTYKLETVFDLGSKLQDHGQPTQVREPNAAYRMLFVKGAFSKNDSKQNIGLKVLTIQLQSMRKREGLRVDSIVVMGPLISIHNSVAKEGFSELTYDEEAVEIIKLIKDEVNKVSPDTEIVFMPSTEDIGHIYPVPQPAYPYRDDIEGKGVHLVSNPGHIRLRGGQREVKINLINTDLLQYMDQWKVGRGGSEILQDNLESYFKQPFLVSNTVEGQFDEVNLPGLYNGGEFGNIVVTSSRHNPPFAREVKGRLYVNVGSLGVDSPHEAGKHFMTLLSIFDGEGPLAGRTKVETLTM